MHITVCLSSRKRSNLTMYVEECHDPDGRGRPVPATSQFPSQRFAVDCRDREYRVFRSRMAIIKKP